MDSVISKLQQALNQILVGKADRIELVLSCVLAGGHLLLEDKPGTGKTLLSTALAQLLGLDYRRIQCTNDMMPSDILGTRVLDQRDQQFYLHRGPIFSQLLLADEINRATPKTQSALLEAMAEGQVTIDGETHTLPAPFFVVATQNPGSHQGTFALPEAQLDRFMMKLSLGHASPEDELQILSGENPRDLLVGQQAVVDANGLIELQQRVRALHSSDAINSYVQRLLQYTRDCGDYETGLSTRAGQAIISAAKANAFINGDDFVLPQHIQTVFDGVARHRLTLCDSAASTEAATLQVIERVAVS